MPYNGSGTFVIAEAPFIPNTPISSADMNSNFDDIASDGLSAVLTLAGEKAMTAALPLANAGAVYGTDPDTGIKRNSANVGALFAGGTDALIYTATGVTIPGTFAVTGAMTFGDGTVSLPGIAFTADPDTGIYRIGANNIGVAANGAKVLDIATTGLGVTGALSATTTITAGTALVATTSVTAGNGLTVTAGAVSLPAGSVASAALAVPAGLIFIKSQTASSSSTIEFINGTSGVVFDGTYDEYVLDIVNLTAATNQRVVNFFVGIGGTPTYQTNNYQGNILETAGATLLTASTVIRLTRDTGSAALSTASGATWNGSIRIFNPAGAKQKLITVEGTYVRDDATGITGVVGGAGWTGTNALTALKIAMDSGNIATGNFYLYGVRKS